MKVGLLADSAALAGLEAAWWDLFARVPAASPFASPAWLLPWWASFGAGDLVTVAVHDGARLVGLAPLYIEEGRWGRRLLPLGLGLGDRLDVLIDPDHAPEVGAALSDRLGGETRWDRWCAEDAPPDAAVLSLPDPPGWCSRVTLQGACPVLDLSPDGLRGVIPPRQWRKWQMARHRADRRSWSIVASTPATLVDDLDHLYRLHGARWRSRGEAGVLGDPAVRRFHAAAAPALLAAGLLRLMVLRLGGCVAGVYYGFARGERAYAYLGGFDPDFSFESPGTLMIGAALEAAQAEGRRSFDFLRGQEAYKYGWGAVDIWTRCRTFEPLR